jgi:penicillin-binding protein 2
MIENGGYGATIAGPIASLMIEKYLRKKITRTDLETRILNISLQGRYAKLGGLSETVKLELRRKDSILKSKTAIPKQKIESNKQN